MVGGAHSAAGPWDAEPWASNGSPSKFEAVSFFGEIGALDVQDQTATGPDHRGAVGGGRVFSRFLFIRRKVFFKSFP